MWFNQSYPFPQMRKKIPYMVKNITKNKKNRYNY